MGRSPQQLFTDSHTPAATDAIAAVLRPDSYLEIGSVFASVSAAGVFSNGTVGPAAVVLFVVSFPLGGVLPAGGGVSTLPRMIGKPFSWSGNASDARRVKVGSCNVAKIVGGQGHDPEPAPPCLVLIAIELPGDLWTLELYWRYVQNVTPNENGFAGTRDAEACVSDFMAGSADSFNVGANLLAVLDSFCPFVKAPEPFLAMEQLKLFLGNKEARQLRECIVSIWQDQPIDMVDVSVGASNRPNPVRSNFRFTQCLRK
jgi:hypothetical protein